MSVPAARRFVRQRLEELGVPAAWEGAQQLVSEVATNAVLHARTPFTVTLTLDGDNVRVSVLDASPALPRLRAYGTGATTGRGLRLVEALAAAWGVEPRDGGKTVWFELPAAGGDSSAEETGEVGDDLLALLEEVHDLEGRPASSVRARHVPVVSAQAASA